MSDTWPQDMSLRFVEMYKQRPLLWNPDDENYYNKSAKYEAWQEIAQELDSTPEICQKKMSCLLSSFRRVRAKQRQARRLTGRSPRFVRWFAYNSLRFLLKRRNRHQTATEELEVSDGIEEEVDEDNDEQIQESDQLADTPNDVHVKLERFTSRTTAEQEYFEPPSKKKKKAIEHVEINIPSVDLNPDVSSEECYSFGNFVANKMKHYSWKTRCSVQHAISNILFDADKGMYENKFGKPDCNGDIE